MPAAGTSGIGSLVEWATFATAVPSFETLCFGCFALLSTAFVAR